MYATSEDIERASIALEVKTVIFDPVLPENC